MAESIQGVPQLQARLRALSPQQAKIMQALALSSVRNAKLLVPRKTSNLGRSIHIVSITPLAAEIEASAKYAAAVEHGTRPHIILPRNKKALFFPSQKLTTARFGAKAILKYRLTGSLSSASIRKYGNAAFAVVKSVHHPGTRAQPFLLRGAQQAIASSEAKDVIVASWNSAA